MKSIARIVSVIALAMVLLGVANAQETEWIRQFGTAGPTSEYASAVDADGNIYVVGYTSGTFPGQTKAGNYDVFVRKYDPSGTEVWTRQFGTSSYDRAHGISVDAGDIFVAGLTEGTLPGQTSAGGTDAFVRKYDLAGTEVWTRQFGSSSHDYAFAISAEAGYICVSGKTSGTLTGQTSAGGFDAFVRMYNAAGNEVWTRQFGTSSVDEASGISVCPEGVWIVGHTYGAFPGQTSAGSYDAFLCKYELDGSEAWTRQFGTSGIEYASGVSADAGNIFVTGYTQGTFPGEASAGTFDAFVCKYELDGTESWTRQFGTSSTDNAYGISVDAGDVYVVGCANGALPGQAFTGLSDAFVRKYDAGGNELWTRQFGTPWNDAACGASVDAGYICVTGYTTGTLPGQTSAGGRDAFVRKYDLAGTEVWTRQFGAVGPASDIVSAVDADGNVYVAGHTYGAFPGETNAGGIDAFVRKYDPSGTEIWTRQFGTSSTDYAHGVSVDAGAVYVAGRTNGTFSGQISAGHGDAFVRKYDPTGAEAWTRQFGTSGTDCAYGASADAGGIYVVGYTQGILPGEASAGSYDAFVRRYDASGNEVWTRQFGTSGSDVADAVSVDAGAIYVGGRTYGTFPGQTSMGLLDAFVRKYDPSGNKGWTRQFGTSSTDYAYGISAYAGGVYVAGYTSGTFPGQATAGETDVFVRRYDAAGNEAWTHQFGTSSHECSYGISANPGGVYVSGYTGGALPGQVTAGADDAFVRRYGVSGTEVWTHQFGTASYDRAYGVSADAGGIYVAGGTFGTFPGQTTQGGDDVFLVKFAFTPVQLLQFLSDQVAAINLRQGIQNNLDAKLDACHQALTDVNQNNQVAAIGALGAFINAVEAQQGTHIPDAEAEELIAAAQEIIELILNSGGGVQSAGGGSVADIGYALSQNSPNPFRKSTTIRYTIPMDSNGFLRMSHVSIKVYDLSGSLVRTVVDRKERTGCHTATWDGRDDLGCQVSNGIYFCHFRADRFTATRRMTIIR